MTRMLSKVVAALVACSCGLSVSVALAADTATAPVTSATNQYGYRADDVAVNQGIVLYWYAAGYRAAFGELPADYAALAAKGLPYGTFTSPFTGAAINPDDGALNFDGDMTYGVSDGEPWVKVQTSSGVVALPSSVTESSDISASYGPCCSQLLCGTCYDPTVACMQWKCFDCDAQAGASIVGWMMWQSFTAHDKLFGAAPASLEAFIASGLSPVDSDFAKYNAMLSIDWTYRQPSDNALLQHSCRNGQCCSHLVKGYVRFAANKCGCNACVQATCAGGKCGAGKCGGGSCNKCQAAPRDCNVCQTKDYACSKCHAKSGGCDKCQAQASSCSKCGSPCQGSKHKRFRVRKSHGCDSCNK